MCFCSRFARVCAGTCISMCVYLLLQETPAQYQSFQITFDFSRLAGCLVMSTDNLIP